MGAGGGDDGGDLDLQSVLPVMKQAAGGGAVTSSERVEAALAAGSEAVQELLSSNLLPQRCDGAAKGAGRRCPVVSLVTRVRYVVPQRWSDLSMTCAHAVPIQNRTVLFAARSRTCLTRCARYGCMTQGAVCDVNVRDTGML